MFILKTLLPDSRMELETLDDSRIISLTLDNSRIQLVTVVQGDFVPPVPVTSPAIAPPLMYPGIIATVSTGIWGGTQPITFTYQWVRDDGVSPVSIPGATGNAYVVQNADIGSVLYVLVTATNIAGSDTISSNTSNTVINASIPANITPPVITGTLAIGNTLSVSSNGTWTGTPAPTFTYQWRIDGAYIATATGPTLLVEAGMETGNIDLLVFGTNIVGSTGALSNEINNFIPPSVITPPSISGSTTEGNILTATDGTWNGALPITYTYQWYQYNGVSQTAIPGATNNTYTTTNADVGFQIRVQVTATNAYGSASSTSSPFGPITSAATLPVNTVAPVVSGTVKMNQVLSCTQGTWTGTPTPTYAYQWRRNTVNIAGATSSTYTVVGADIAGLIDCVVTATNVAGSVSQASSNTLASVWQPILSIKPNAIIFDGKDPYCTGGASVGAPVQNVYSVNGVLIATQAISSKRAARTSLGLSFDGTDDEYIGEAGLLNYYNGNHTLIASLSSLSGLTNRTLLHAYVNSGDVEYVRINAANAASTARNYYRRQSIGSTYTLIQYPVATTWRMVVTTALGAPGTSNLYDLTSGVTLHQTASANLVTANLEAWKFGGYRDSNAWMQGIVECYGIDDTTWDTTAISVFRGCAINAGVM